MIKKLGSKLKEQKGFTLIELLAVIVILGIIAAIAIPAIGNVINRSEAKATAQEGVQIINSAKMFMANEPSSAMNWGTADGGITPANANEAVLVKAGELDKYLDRVKSKSSFYVIVTRTSATSGKYSYKLGAHESAPTNGTIVEQDLVDNAQ